MIDFEYIYSNKNELYFVSEVVLPSLEWCRENGYKSILPGGIDENSNKKKINEIIRGERDGELFKIKSTEINKMILKNKDSLKDFFSSFDYPLPQKVKVFFSLYGTGGNYGVPDSVLIRFDKKTPITTFFKNIIHETVHLIIEEPFVIALEIPHKDKEAIVDAICVNSKIKDLTNNYKSSCQTSKENLANLVKKLKIKEGSLLKRSLTSYLKE